MWGEILLQIQPNLLTLNPFVDMELFEDDPVATVEVPPLALFWGINSSLAERLLAIGPGFLSYGCLFGLLPERSQGTPGVRPGRQRGRAQRGGQGRGPGGGRRP